jgi:hypothetical protein
VSTPASERPNPSAASERMERENAVGTGELLIQCVATSGGLSYALSANGVAPLCHNPPPAFTYLPVPSLCLWGDLEVLASGFLGCCPTVASPMGDNARAARRL